MALSSDQNVILFWLKITVTDQIVNALYNLWAAPITTVQFCFCMPKNRLIRATTQRP